MKVEFLVLILTEVEIADRVLRQFFGFLLLLGLGGSFDSVRVLGSELDSLAHQELHNEDVQVVLAANKLSLLLLAGEGVSHQADLHREPVGVLRVLQFGAFFIVDLDDLLEGVTKEEVVIGHV